MNFFGGVGGGLDTNVQSITTCQPPSPLEGLLYSLPPDRAVFYETLGLALFLPFLISSFFLLLPEMTSPFPLMIKILIFKAKLKSILLTSVEGLLNSSLNHIDLSSIKFDYTLFTLEQ